MRKSPILYAFLFAIYAPLFLYNHNNGWFTINELTVPLAVTILAAGILLSFLWLIIRDLDTAAAVTAFWGISFFSYGHLLSAKQHHSFFPVGLIERHAIWVWLFVLVIGTMLLLRLRRQIIAVRVPLSVCAFVLVAFSSIQIGYYELNRLHPQNIPSRPQLARMPSTHPTDPGQYPDIYYIILDGYARPDVFKELYEADSSHFINYLKRKRFFIADQSHSNYSLTTLSLSSALNMSYLDTLVKQIGKDSVDQSPVKQLLKQNAAIGFLKERGYTILCMSQDGKTEIAADMSMPMDKGKASALSVSPMPPFKSVVLEMTPLRLLLHGGRSYKIQLDEPDKDLFARIRKLRLEFFNNLNNLPKTRAPQFVFAHIIAPHPPFLFMRDGKPLPQEKTANWSDGVIGLGGVNETRESYTWKYREQYLFISAKLQQSLEKLLVPSARPKVVIIQSDHGPGAYFDWYNTGNCYARERMSILNAYYFSNGVPETLYDTMTPINTFRVIFNHYFHTDYPLLPDKSYLSISMKPYDYIDVTDKTGKLPPDKLPQPYRF